LAGGKRIAGLNYKGWVRLVRRLATASPRGKVSNGQ